MEKKMDVEDIIIRSQKLTKLYESIESEKEFIDLTLKYISNYTQFNAISIFLFNSKGNLIHKKSEGIDLEEETKSKISIKENDFLNQFKKKNIEIIEKFYEKKNYFELKKLNEIYTLIILPIKNSKQLFGFITCGYFEEKKISDNKILFLQKISLIINSAYVNLLKFTKINFQLKEIREIAKKIRHDFANDLQSIAMSIELLASTNLSEEQQKFVRILTNARISAVNRINEFKDMKSLYESEIKLTEGFMFN